MGLRYIQNVFLKELAFLKKEHSEEQYNGLSKSLSSMDIILGAFQKEEAA